MPLEYAEEDTGERSCMLKVWLLEDKAGVDVGCGGSHWPGNSAALSCEGCKQAIASIQIQTLTLATCKWVTSLTSLTSLTSQVCFLLFHGGFCTEHSFDILALGSLLVWGQLIVHPQRHQHISLLQRCLESCPWTCNFKVI